MTDSSDIAAKARESLKGITPGPWRHNSNNGVHRFDGEWVALTYGPTGIQRFTDADFIASAPTLVADLLDALDAAKARLAAIDDLFAGGPDTACRTTWPDGLECVEVPMKDLRAALGDVTQ